MARIHRNRTVVCSHCERTGKSLQCGETRSSDFARFFSACAICLRLACTLETPRSSKWYGPRCGFQSSNAASRPRGACNINDRSPLTKTPASRRLLLLHERPVQGRSLRAASPPNTGSSGWTTELGEWTHVEALASGVLTVRPQVR